jgi:hypothetical protein
MKNEINITNRQQELDRLCREPSVRFKETAILNSPGTGTLVHTVRIQGNSSYNVYNVANVTLGDPGCEPVAVGMDDQAINLAEPFDQQGTVPVGTYVIIFRLGNKYIFYAKP